MRKMSVVVFGFLLAVALSTPVKVQEESETKFHGDDFHIQLPSKAVEITFRPNTAPRAADVVLMRGGVVVGVRAKLNLHGSHLVLDNVDETDEGVYTLKNPDTPEDIRRIRLIVRDCTNEDSVKYGDNYVIHLLGVTSPITLEYRHLAVEANMTSRPALVLMTSAGLSRDGYHGRITVSERHVSLSTATGADEGSYTIRDAEGNIKKKVCLNVQEHYYFEELPYDGVLKINLHSNSSLVRLYYSTTNHSKPTLLMDKGEIIAGLTDVDMENRLYMKGSVVVLEGLRASDAGQFKVIDVLGFPVAVIHLELEPYKLPMVFVAVKKRARRAAELEKIAENAGKEDEGEAFRQSTEVDIKGLEVSSKEVGVDNMETSDSGVGFNTTALPLDTDTDVADQILDSEAGSISVAPAAKPSPPAAAPAAAVTQPSAPPAVEIQPPPPTAKTAPEAKLDIPTFSEVKLSPAQSPEPRLGLSPGSKAKTPEPKPLPSPAKASSPMVPSAHATAAPPSPQPKLTPTPEPRAMPVAFPTVNGTPEPALGFQASPEPAPKVAPPKTPEVEMKAETPVAQGEDTTTIT
ncbi:hypothetical protein NHX12_000851 [Muraenolepis orangiensis]|uniref:Uncharacterized protein n=1 Tax=Muraenolepis orangiensis TaxID=630683 RepID=A0A9Q0DZT6_9TELE|nr:hypothetical protein NHX12_000851 [Muraenolepis orangiensis]